MRTLQIRTSEKESLVDITNYLTDVVREEGIQSGILVVYIPHTTAGVTINENADPSVKHDILADLSRLVPDRQPYYRHREGNSAAHLKASLVGSSVQVIIQESRLVLGTWQGVYLAEFDGPRNRKIHLQLIGA